MKASPGSPVIEQSLVALVVPDPEDPELGSQWRTARDGVQRSPAVGEFEAEEIGKVAERPGDQAPANSIAQKRFSTKSRSKLPELLPLLPAGCPEFVLVHEDFGLGQSPTSWKTSVRVS